MNKFAQNYIQTQGLIFSGGSVKDLHKKLSKFNSFFQVCVSETEPNQYKLIFNEEKIKNISPSELFNNLFKQFYNDMGSLGTASRSIDALKKALKEADVTFSEGNYGKVAKIKSVYMETKPPQIEDEEKIFKPIDKKLLTEEQPKAIDNNSNFNPF